MGIAQDRFHKKRATGGRIKLWRKKRKFELGRPPATTKLAAKRVRPVRTRGGNRKFRALRLDHGNFSWSTEHCTRKAKILDVVYNASNNELVRTKTLVKNAIIKVDATPFKNWYKTHYHGQVQDIGDKTDNVSKKQKEKLIPKIDPILKDSMRHGYALACISSRPGQVGRIDGYILESKELEFYRKKLDKKKAK